MTDRYCAFIVVLDKEIREDDAQPILDAIRMIKSVQSVEPIVAESTLYIARENVRSEYREKFHEFWTSLLWDR